jgi:hypothetical protein
MINNNTPLLAAFGIGMGFSADDMHDMIIDVYASMSENGTMGECNPLDDVACVVAGMDSKTLWTGAMLYGYIIDAYKDIDVSDAIKDCHQKT